MHSIWLGELKIEFTVLTRLIHGKQLDKSQSNCMKMYRHDIRMILSLQGLKDITLESICFMILSLKMYRHDIRIYKIHFLTV
jgi:hypothetical protein